MSGRELDHMAFRQDMLMSRQFDWRASSVRSKGFRDRWRYVRKVNIAAKQNLVSRYDLLSD
jgi:hypothetical protein